MSDGGPGSGDEILERASAPTADRLQNPDHELVYLELTAESPDTYDESLIEYANEEGRSKVLVLRSQVGEPMEI